MFRNCGLVIAILLFSCPCAELSAQSFVVPPPFLYRDPCVEWGLYDYGMGTAQLVNSSSGQGITTTFEFDIADGGVLLATIEGTQTYGAPATFRVVQQHVEGTIDLDVLELNYSPSTGYTWFDEYNSLFTGGRAVNAYAYGTSTAKVVVTIDDECAEYTAQYCGEYYYYDFVLELKGIYSVL